MKIKRLGRRNVEADFDGGQMTSDAGALLLGKVDEHLNLLGRFASCFTDHRNPKFTEHSVPELVRQRVFGLALGYEDLNDHDELSRDPLLATVVGKTDPTGQSRYRNRATPSGIPSPRSSWKRATTSGPCRSFLVTKT